MPNCIINCVGKLPNQVIPTSNNDCSDIRRLDIFVSLSTGQPAHYLVKGAAEPVFSGTNCTFFESVPMNGTQHVNGIAESNLINIFHQIQQLAKSLNLAAVSSHDRILDNDFQNCYCWLQYRLLQLEWTITDNFSECFRLAMLAFMTTLFQIPGFQERKWSIHTSHASSRSTTSPRT